MYRAKESGRDRIEMFQGGMRARAIERLDYCTNLHLITIVAMRSG
jgi:hypothetical protein